MSVEHVWAGALTDTAIRVRARVTGSSTRLAVSLLPDLSSPVYFGPVVPTADDMVTLDATGLTADTRYYYAIEDDSVLDTAFSGTFRTQPVVAGEVASYTIGMAGDAGLTGSAGDASYITSQVSNNPVFDTMRAQAIAEDWVWFSHLGDLHYRNISTATASLYRTAFNDNFTFNGTLGAAARQGLFFRNVASTYVWDDHDFGPNNSDRTAAGNATANSVYRERVPHYTLPGGSSGIYQSWQCGRVLFVQLDCRTFRDPNSDPDGPAKTMIGTAQRAWLEALLAANAGGAEALMLISSSRWIGGDDTWSSFLYDREAVVQILGDTGWLERMVLVTADEHSLSFGSGPHNAYGRFPMFMFASMDANYGSASREIYDIGNLPGRQQYGTVDVIDKGHTIQLKGTGWVNGVEWMNYSKYVDVGSPVFQVNYQAGQIYPPFEPVSDDQNLVNDVTATRIQGSSVRYEKTDGSLSINEPPTGVGRYDESVTLNVASDAQLPGQAGWRVHVGTVNAYRYPSTVIKLNGSPELLDEYLDLSLGDKLEVLNPPSWLPPGDIQMISEGLQESINWFSWDVGFNSSPGEPWTVGQIPIGEDAGTDRPNRAATSGSELHAAVDADDTELLVLTPQDGIYDRVPWIISEGLADSQNLLPTHLPFDVELSGEIMEVSSIEPFAYDSFARVVAAGSWGTSDGGKAWSLSGGTDSERSVDGTYGLVTLTSAPTTIRFQTLPGSVGDCEIRAILSSTQVATGASIVPGILLRFSDTSNYYRARLHFGVSGTMFTSITRGTTVVGSAPSLPFTYAANDEFHVRVRIEGDRILMRAWPVDSVEPDVWHNDRTVTDTPIASGQIGTTVSTVAGNTNVNPVIRVRDYQVENVQAMTVIRGVNGISKAHAVATAVQLAQPAVVAL